MYFDVVIVGAGVAGCVLARRMAEEKNKKILLVERQNHIGGFCYDYRNKNGILIQQYGPHIFRTDKKYIYEYLSKFTQWYDYQHKVLSYVGGHYYPMPINLDTVNLFTGGGYSSETVLSYFETVKTHPAIKNNVKDVIESQIGKDFYEAFYKQYTTKQWGINPEKLPPSIIARIPIRTNKDDRYFSVQYQGIPQNGYTAMLNSMLEHPNIHLMLGTDFRQIKKMVESDIIYYSGSIDECWDYCYGKLPYRCVNFKFEEYNMDYFQPVAVVNYPNDYDYTRITEFKHFTPSTSHNTVIAKEYPCDSGSPSYPIPLENNINLYKKYLQLADSTNIVFIGRLGQYKYLSMDQVIDEVLMLKI